MRALAYCAQALLGGCYLTFPPWQAVYKPFARLDTVAGYVWSDATAAQPGPMAR